MPAAQPTDICLRMLRRCAGTLSAAKFDQTSDENGGAFSISWIPLGSANNAELEVGEAS